MSKEITVYAELSRIQKDLKAPKDQKNNFGNYNYRSAEDILEAYKKVKGDTILTLNDELIMVGERYYVKATATLTCSGESVTTTAFAREEENKKGMDGSQITGASSSYARKYALNGLFCIDDTKDSDTTNTGDKKPTVVSKAKIDDEKFKNFLKLPKEKQDKFLEAVELTADQKKKLEEVRNGTKN